MRSTNSQPQPTAGTARDAHWDTRPIHDPVTASWNLRISQSDSQKMIHGFIPKEMEDKWLCYSTTPDNAQGITVVHLCRSWGKTEQIALKVQQADAINDASGSSQTWIILDITWERRVGEQDLGEQEAKEDAIRVCNYILDCALPEDEPESYLPAK
ncbi:hypothetical protein MBR_10519, partial [Metarhizium brunneum ARSEF 3297]